MPATIPPGRSIVTRRAVVDVVRAAVLRSYGVTGLGQPTLAGRLARAVGLGEPGISVHLTPRLEVELWLTVAAGLPIAEVARQADAGVRHALRQAIGREIDGLVIHVDDLRVRGRREAAPVPASARPTDRNAAPRAEASAPNAATRVSCTGAGLLVAYRSAVENLEAHVDEINALNVYPVPDGDTGSNMAATVRAALVEAEKLDDDAASRVAGAIGFGALMGARGNSGVITSQIFRGMAEALGTKRRFNGLDLAHALSLGSAAAYKAVVKPVEGTILTVIRETAEAAVVAAERSNDIESVLTAAVGAAQASVNRTPSLLPILHDAGVVDAGGQGLVRLFQGALTAVVATSPTATTRGAPAPARASTLIAHADDGFGYETMFLVQPAPARHLDLDDIRHALEGIGESVLVAGDQRAAKVHVHSERPDQVLEYGMRLGSLSRISVENLDAQARDVRERRASEFTGATSAGGVAPARSGAPGGAVTPSPSQEDGAAPVSVPLAVIAVAAGDGLAAVFESFGCAAVVRGGQGANPSTGELMAAIEEAHADDVLLLPNNANVLLAARQVAAMTPTRVSVVPTRNAAEGVAALLSLDPKASAADNARTMTDAARAIQTLQVTEAVRDARIGSRKVRHGQTIVLDPDDGVVAADGDGVRAVIAGIDALAPGFELITIYYGEGADLASAEGLGRDIAQHRPEVDVEIVRGGQPHYRYLIAAE